MLIDGARSSAWLERFSDKEEVGSSNLPGPINIWWLYITHSNVTFFYHSLNIDKSELFFLKKLKTSLFFLLNITVSIIIKRSIIRKSL